jgi:hypothetical protein
MVSPTASKTGRDNNLPPTESALVTPLSVASAIPWIDSDLSSFWWYEFLYRAFDSSVEINDQLITQSTIAGERVQLI